MAWGIGPRHRSFLRRRWFGGELAAEIGSPECSDGEGLNGAARVMSQAASEGAAGGTTVRDGRVWPLCGGGRDVVRAAPG